MITLRPLRIEDMQTILDWRHEHRETLRTPYMLTREMQEQWYRDVICNRESHTRYWGVWRPATTWTCRICGDIEPTEAFGEYRPGEAYHDIGGIKHSVTRWPRLVGYGGLENISWENGNAEISLLIGTKFQRKGYGRRAVELFLTEAFDRMRLNAVYGECYECGPWDFWDNFFPDDQASVWLKDRKYWDGEYYDSYYFTFRREDYERVMRDSCERRVEAATAEEHQTVPRGAGNSALYQNGKGDWVLSGGGIE